MAPAQESLTAAACQLTRFMRDVPQVSTLDGAVLAEDEAPELGAQLVEPVSWRRVVDTLVRYAITDVAVVAPGRALRNLLRDVLGASVQVHSAEDETDLDVIANTLDAHAKKEAAAS